VAASSGTPAKPPFAELDVRAAWRLDDAQIEADAVDFWTRLRALPAGTDPWQRAKELVAVAYKDGRLIAMATAVLEWSPHLRARFAVLRGATDPDFRRSHAQLALAVPSRRALERWAIANPDEKLAGGLAFIEPGEWGDFTRLPVWPQSELALVGYLPDGRQVRAAWFDHFRYD
jgi:hypothetical protein